METQYLDGKQADPVSTVGTIILEEGITSIAEKQFLFCDKLEKIILPDSLTKIGDYAFKDCSSLTEIKLPDSLTSIDYWAFKDCSSLTEINFPDSLTSIYGWAFKGCSSLTEIKLPDSLTYIGDRAFYGCTSLTEINFPDSLTSIDSYAFAYCSSLKKITYHKKTEELLKDYFGDKWNSFEKVLIAEDLPKVPSNEKKFAATFKEIEELFAKAKTCDPDALVQLKNFIKRAQDLIASLYYDGNKKMRSAQLF